MSDTITSIADNLQRLADVTDAIGEAIAAAGGTVGQYDRLEQYPDDIATITPAKLTTKTITENGIYNANDETTVTVTQTDTTYPITFNTINNTLNDYNIRGNVDNGNYVGDAATQITSTDTDYTDLQNTYELNIPISSWNEVRDIVRSGKAPLVFSVGSIIYDDLNMYKTGGTTNNTIAWQVIGYDKYFDPNLTRQGYNHSLTLCELWVDETAIIDSIEALMYCSTDMPAGTYRFKIPNYDTTYGGNRWYVFTFNSNITEGSQIYLTWNYQQQPSSVSVYSSATATTATQSYSFPVVETIDNVSYKGYSTDPGTGYYLGEVTFSTTPTTNIYGVFNHIHRARYGSNNYYQSGIRQYINSTSTSTGWWEPQTIFDRPHNKNNSIGRMNKYSTEFKNVLATPVINTPTSIFEYPSLDGTTFIPTPNGTSQANTNFYNIYTDKMFLLSHTDINLTATPNTQSNTGDNIIQQYYIKYNTNNDRIKRYRSNNNVSTWWLRTPYPTYASNVRFILSLFVLYFI